MDGWTDIIGRFVARLRDERRAARGHGAASWSWPTSRRWSRSGRGSTPSSRTRRPPRRSSPGTGSSASDPCFHDEYLQAFNRPERHTGRHPGTRCGAHHGTTAWSSAGRRVRGRLPHLCHRLRGRYRLHTPGRLRRARLGRPPLRALARRHALTPRHARARLPQHVRPESHAGRLHGQLPASARPGLRRTPRHIVRHALDHDLREVEVPPPPRTNGCRPWPSQRATSAPFRSSAPPATTTTKASPGGDGFMVSSYGKGPIPFFELLAAWRRSGQFEGLELRS